MNIFINGINAFTSPFDSWQNLYLSEALGKIAWAVIITSIVFYFISRKDGLKKVNRNSIIVLCLAGIFLFLSNWFRELVTTWSDINFEGFGLYPSNGPQYFTNIFAYFYHILTDQILHNETPLIIMITIYSCGFGNYGHIQRLLLVE